MQPEILDRLPEDHPDALANRRDMRRLNFLMGNFAWLTARLRESRAPPGSRVVEVAAGDGTFGDYILQRLPAAREWKYTGVDLWGRPRNWPGFWNWEQADVRSCRAADGARIIVANHILHQFNDRELSQLGPHLTQTAHRLVCNEPCRRSLHVWQARAGFLLGLNYVSRHDAVTSVRAGFLGDELPRALGLDSAGWMCSVRTTWLGAYRFTAQKIPPVP